MNMIILGGGIAGLTAAIALKRVGIRAVVYEAAPQIRAVGAGLVLAANAMKAFHKLQIGQAVMAYALFFTHRNPRLLEALVGSPLPRLPGLYRVQYWSLHRKEPPRCTRLITLGSSGS
jgi:2-polyprenyl-6-methoxyphenol hydroxylase-like FAD-dependent oxidoreductase